MVCKNYPHNYLRFQLKNCELLRFNAYKKRECERRRRYRVKGMMDHPNYKLNRCEVCRKFFKDVNLIMGFTSCETCLKDVKQIRLFLLRKNPKEMEWYTVNEYNVNDYILPKPVEEKEKVLSPTWDTIVFEDDDSLDLEGESYRIFLENEFQKKYPHPSTWFNNYQDNLWTNEMLYLQSIFTRTKNVEVMNTV